MNLKQIKEVARGASSLFMKYNFTPIFKIEGDLPDRDIYKNGDNSNSKQALYDALKDKKVALYFSFMGPAPTLKIDLDITVEELIFYMMNSTGAYCYFESKVLNGTSSPTVNRLSLGASNFRNFSAEDKDVVNFLGKMGYLIGDSGTSGLVGYVFASVPFFKLYKSIIDKLGMSGDIRKWVLRNYWRTYFDKVDVFTEQGYPGSGDNGQLTTSIHLYFTPESSGSNSSIQSWVRYTNSFQTAANSNEQLGASTLDELCDLALKIKLPDTPQGLTFQPISGDTILTYSREGARRNELPKVIVTSAHLG